MEISWVHVGAEAGSDKFRLRHAIPAFVLYVNLDSGVCRKLELLLLLRGRRRRIRRSVFDAMTDSVERRSGLALVEMIQHHARSCVGIAGHLGGSGCGCGNWAVKNARPVHIHVFEPIGGATGVRGRIDPGVSAAGMFGEGSFHEES